VVLDATLFSYDARCLGWIGFDDAFGTLESREPRVDIRRGVVPRRLRGRWRFRISVVNVAIAQVQRVSPWAPGATTTLTWSAANVTACTASSGWSGAKSLSGSEASAPLNSDQTYQLSCTGPNGNVLAMTNVTLRSAVVSWTAPTQNSDGSSLTDLAGFKVRWGSASRNYTFSASVTGPAATTFQTALDPGTWYFAVTALNAAGQESAPSSEATRTVL
jgi:hypothetical protein